MGYKINRTNGDLIVDVTDATVNTKSTDISLIGKNALSYGEHINENFIKLLENFSSKSRPKMPLPGQLWYDTSSERLKVYTGTEFKNINGPIVSEEVPPTLTSGDLWINSNTNQLWFYDGSELTLAGPIYTASQGVSGFTVETVLDTLRKQRVIVKLWVANVLLGVFSSHTDTFELLNAIPNLPTVIVTGFTQANIDGFLFNAVAENTEALLATDGTLKTVKSFMSTETNTGTIGTVSITNDLPLILGAEQTISITSTINQFEIYNNEISPIIVQVKDTNGIKDAITIDTTSKFVGIFNPTPTHPLDINGSLTVSNVVRVSEYIESTTPIINVKDKFFVLNSLEQDSGVSNIYAGITVARDTEQPAVFRWNEILDKWEYSNGDGIYKEVLTPSLLSPFALTGNYNDLVDIPEGGLWTPHTNGIYYNSGNVGINTQDLARKFSVNGIVSSTTIVENFKTLEKPVDPGGPVLPSVTTFLTANPNHTGAWGATASDNGMHFYVADADSATIYQYDATIPWDTTTITYSKLLSCGCSSAEDIKISSDGTKMVIINANTTNNLETYELSTPWDITTATLLSFASWPANSSYGGEISRDGSKVYIVDTSGSIYHGIMATPWDVSTITWNDATYSLVINSEGFALTSDGTRVLDADGSVYLLGTPWDLSTATFEGTSQYTTIVGGCSSSIDSASHYFVGFSNDNQGFYITYIPDIVNLFNLPQPTLWTETLNIMEASLFRILLTDDVILQVSNVPADNKASAIMLEVVNFGAFSITWWPNIIWVNGAAPTLSTTVDSIGVYTTNGGQTWIGIVYSAQLVASAWPLWAATLTDLIDVYAATTAIDSAGNSIVVSKLTAFDTNILVSLYNNTGALGWQKVISLPNTENNIKVITNDSFITIYGHMANGSIFLISLTIAGVMQGDIILRSPIEDSVTTSAAVVLFFGNIYCFKNVTKGSNYYLTVTMLDATTVEILDARVFSVEYPFIIGDAIVNNSDIILISTSVATPTLLLSVYNSNMGTFIHKEITQPEIARVTSSKLTVDSLYVSTVSTLNIVVYSFDHIFNLKWTSTVGLIQPPTTVAVSADNSAVYILIPLNSTSLTVTKISSAGNTVWTRRVRNVRPATGPCAISAVLDTGFYTVVASVLKGAVHAQVLAKFPTSGGGIGTYDISTSSPLIYEDYSIVINTVYETTSALYSATTYVSSGNSLRLYSQGIIDNTALYLPLVFPGATDVVHGIAVINNTGTISTVYGVNFGLINAGNIPMDVEIPAVVLYGDYLYYIGNIYNNFTNRSSGTVLKTDKLGTIIWCKILSYEPNFLNSTKNLNLRVLHVSNNVLIVGSEVDDTITYRLHAAISNITLDGDLNWHLNVLPLDIDILAINLSKSTVFSNHICYFYSVVTNLSIYCMLHTVDLTTWTHEYKSYNIDDINWTHSYVNSCLVVGDYLYVIISSNNNENLILKIDNNFNIVLKKVIPVILNSGMWEDTDGILIAVQTPLTLVKIDFTLQVVWAVSISNIIELYVSEVDKAVSEYSLWLHDDISIVINIKLPISIETMPTLVINDGNNGFEITITRLDNYTLFGNTVPDVFDQASLLLQTSSERSYLYSVPTATVVNYSGIIKSSCLMLPLLTTTALVPADYTQYAMSFHNILDRWQRSTSYLLPTAGVITLVNANADSTASVVQFPSTLVDNSPTYNIEKAIGKFSNPVAWLRIASFAINQARNVIIIYGHSWRDPIDEGYIIKVSLGSPDVVNWQKRIGTLESTYARNVVIDSNNNVIVLVSNSNRTIYTIMKFSSDGALIFEKTVTNLPDGVGTNITTDLLGNIILVCNRNILIKCSGDGELLWSKIVVLWPYNGLIDGLFNFNAVDVDSLGNVYVAGYVEGTVDTIFESYGVLYKFSNIGELSWAKMLKSTYAYAVKCYNDKVYFLLDDSTIQLTSSQAAVVIDSVTGNINSMTYIRTPGAYLGNIDVLGNYVLLTFNTPSGGYQLKLSSLLSTGLFPLFVLDNSITITVEVVTGRVFIDANATVENWGLTDLQNSTIEVIGEGSPGAAYSITHIAVFGNTHGVSFFAVCDSLDNLYIIGNAAPYDYVLKLTVFNVIEWIVTTYNYNNSQFEYQTAIIADNALYIVASYDPRILKMSLSGQILAQNPISISNYTTLNVKKIVSSSTGILICGYGQNYWIVMKLTFSLQVVWHRLYTTPVMYAWGMALDNSGGVVVIGRDYAPGTGCYLVRFLESTGDAMFIRKFNSTVGVMTYPQTVTISSDDSIYVSGYTYTYYFYCDNPFILKFDINGVLQQQRAVGRQLYSYMYDQSLITIGSSVFFIVSQASGYQLYLIKLSSNLDVVYMTSINKSDGGAVEHGSTLKTSYDNITMVIRTNATGFWGTTILKIDNNQNMLGIYSYAESATISLSGYSGLTFYEAPLTIDPLVSLGVAQPVSVLNFGAPAWAWWVWVPVIPPAYFNTTTILPVSDYVVNLGVVDPDVGPSIVTSLQNQANISVLNTVIGPPIEIGTLTSERFDL